jgi:hypothetical protein
VWLRHAAVTKMTFARVERPLKSTDQ